MSLLSKFCEFIKCSCLVGTAPSTGVYYKEYEFTVTFDNAYHVLADVILPDTPGDTPYNTASTFVSTDITGGDHFGSMAFPVIVDATPYASGIQVRVDNEGKTAATGTYTGRVKTFWIPVDNRA